MFNYSTPTSFWNSTSPATDDQVYEPFGARVFRLFLFAVVFFVAVVGNIMVLLIVYKTQALRSVTGYMIANLAIADLGVAIFCLPFTVVYKEKGSWPFGLVFCKIMSFVQPLSVLASVGTLTFISIDRYRCIVKTFSTRLSLSVFKYVICLIWAISLIFALPLAGISKVIYYGGMPYCVEAWPAPVYELIYNITSFSVSYGVPLLIMLYLYIRIARAMNKVVREGGNREGFTSRQKKDRLLRLLLALVIAYATCFFPYHVIFMWVFVTKDGQNYKGRNILITYSLLLVYVNSAFNPILYAFMGNKFKNGFKALLPCQRFQTFDRYQQTTRTVVHKNNGTFQSDATL